MDDYLLTNTGEEVQTDINEGLDNQPKDNFVWDDFAFSVSNLRVNPVTSKPDYDQNENEYLFDANSTETVVGSGITSHKYKLGVPGMTWRPHIHWVQEAVGKVQWQLEYKLWPANELEPASYTTLQIDKSEFTYTAGALHQIDIFPYIDMSAFNSTAIMVKFKVSRLGGDVQDTYPGDARLLSFDIHVPIDQLGSRQEFIK